jgi:predicted membrane protein
MFYIKVIIRWGWAIAKVSIFINYFMCINFNFLIAIAAPLFIYAYTTEETKKTEKRWKKKHYLKQIN